ncbi:uncharacterized protein BJ212DRAFT_1449816 [Suillus subaureus]|uniref:Uncharacterized protein n=1 Tax=Suillus subaureus TaxID=48587 RepID=A0A9P7DVV9_9AGAM|nr:uncharacterized protein BJ212DRAFT_1449816 [Suillus subaureus]KAG1804163.1 hypothetical protein BJ212DRAFT_1449816 [Suillus subaureus]
MGITMEALELYHMAHIRSPHFCIQTFVKTMCDLHGVSDMVMKSIQRDSPNWHLRHTCLACSYVLADEEQLTFKMLYTMDKNDSLKQVIRRTLNNNNLDSVGISSELPTGQLLTSNHYLSCSFVNQFAQNLLSATSDDVNMVQSGELAKYPLAVVARMLKVFGDDLGAGYDISCQFKITLNNSSLGPLICSLHHLCLLSSLTTYIKGLGLKDLETCEHTFSKSNSLTSALHYASVFHHQQAIDSYFDHNDNIEVYGNLSNFLHCNYKQALNILATGNVMQDLKIRDNSVFESWLDEEKAYLNGLSQEPEEEMLQIEYWQRLCHAVEDYDRNLKLVQALEYKLEVSTRWVPENTDWQKVGRLIANRKYQCALDHLEGLVVACIFELTKMNRAGTGYKLHKHIVKALQTPSVAIRAALNTYNAIASAMATPQQTLQWEEVVNYAFLTNFDLLCNAWADVSQLLDEDSYLQFSSPALANQLAIHHNIQGHFNAHHLKWLHNISMLPGFSKTLVPGLSTHTSPGESASMPDIIPANILAGPILMPKPSFPYMQIHMRTWMRKSRKKS